MAQVSLRFLVQLEGGKGNISVQRLAEVCAALEISLAKLFRGLGAHGATVLALVGLRGSGKSTIGPIVAKELGYPFVELDKRITTLANIALSEIFEIGGSDYYHSLEQQALGEIFESHQPCVLATGGSIVSASDNWRLLQNYSVTIWLQASPKAHLNRVQMQGDLRPMEGHGDALAKLKQILIHREPFYANSALHVNTEKFGIEGSVQEIIRFVR